MEERKFNKPNLYYIIPKPNFIINEANRFIVNRDTTIIFSKGLNPLAILLANFLEKNYDLDLELHDSESIYKNNHCIFLQLRELGDKIPDAYHLRINEDKIDLIATTKSGIFYGIQSLVQLIHQNNLEFNKTKASLLKLNGVEIRDSPRFQWRGFMLDEGRHFFGKEIVKNILDIMALLKLNIFHWHLTDDQGWRIEIKKYPRLTEIGSKRKGTNVSMRRFYINSSVNNKESDGIPVMGFYTQEEIKEIIEYATERYITVIPEIDLPGHTMALLASYPELSCTGGPFEVGTQFGIYRDVLCIGKELVFEYVENILSEIIKLFPSEYIHIGGDEAPRTRWKKCFDCQARLVKEKIESVDGLQVYFTNRISEFLKAYGKKVVSWNETIDKNLNKEIYCQYWNGTREEILNELKEGRKIIISEINSNYFNYPYKLNSLKNTYQFDPIPEELPEQFHKNIIGIEACVWTELIKTQEKLEWQLFPRLFATAEIGWSQKINKNYQDFEKRLEILLKDFEKKGINYASKEEYDGTSTARAKIYLEGT